VATHDRGHLHERIEAGEACSLSRRWLLAPSLANRLVALEVTLDALGTAEGVRWPGLWIISGHRTAAEQREINPDNPDSLHTRCPSLAADLRIADIPASATPDGWWAFVGGVWGTLGGRWGGRFEPPDQNHFDLPTLGDARPEDFEKPEFEPF